MAPTTPEAAHSGMAAVRWRVGHGRVLGPAPFLLAGIVNVTPDSFSDGGRDPVAALAHARQLAAEGAHVLDVGGESTRPGAAEVPQDEELRRVLPVVESLAADGLAVSVDTSRAAVAAACLQAGAMVVNDVSACRRDPGLPDVLAQYRPGYVLMHSQGTPQTMQQNPRYDDVLAEVLAFLEERLGALVAAGLPEERIVLDPGIGFGKTLAHNLALLRGLPRLARLGRPLFLGVSRKSFLGGLLGLGLQERDAATQVATALAFAAGAAIHRVHDVAGARRALELALAMGHDEAV